MSTPIQEYAQAPGPHKHTAFHLFRHIMAAIPRHCIVEAVSINGQTGGVTVEYMHEDLHMKKEIQIP